MIRQRRIFMMFQKDGSKVHIAYTAPESVIEDYGELMRTSEYWKYLESEHRILLKLNLSWSLYFPACSTTPWQLEGVLKTLRQDGFTDILAIENKTVVTDTKKGLKQNKWNKVLKKYDIDFLPLTDVMWIPYKPSADTPALDKIFPEGFKIPDLLIDTNIIHLPTMKTHGHTTITGAMKNAFGGLLKERRHHCHKYIHEVIVDLLKIQREIHIGMFNVMDGTVCGDGAGPRTMVPKIKNLILASQDPVAIDSIAAKIMSFDPMKIGKIRLADELGLGNGALNKIKVIGEDITNLNFGFNARQSLVVWGDKLLRKGRLRFLEPFIFHTPLFKIPVLLSALYHDHFWYPLIGKKHINDFMHTDWGVLFEKY